MTDPRTRVYERGTLVAEDFPVREVSEYLRRPDTMVWVDFLAPSAADLEELAGELGLHELAIEDAVGRHQRPKLDHYDSHLFLSSHAVTVDPEAGVMAEVEVDAFINSRWFVTVRKDPTFSIERVTQRWDRSPDLTKHGVGFLLYGLLDVIVDDYFEALEVFDEYYDDVSETLLSETPLPPARQRRWFQMRQALVHFHRLAVPMREAVSAIMRREQGTVVTELYPYYQDVYDHVLRVSESSDVLRDLVSTIVETDLALRDYRQNQVMKQVTSWAAIIAVPTLITGYYGMNVPYPGSGEAWGAWASTGASAAISASLYALFKHREWL